MSTRTRKALLGVLMALATFVTTMVVATPAQAVQYYLIQNRYSDKCLAIGGGDQTPGAHAIQWTCNRSYTEQQWQVDSADRWRNRYTDKCLAIGGGSYANGADAVQWTCSTNDDQRWISYSYQQYRNLNSGLCLAIGDSDTSNGAHAIQWTCSQIGSFEQQWVFIPV